MGRSRAAEGRLNAQAALASWEGFDNRKHSTARRGRPGALGPGRSRMTMIRPFEGSLFAEDFLREAITQLPDWDLDDGGLVADLEVRLARPVRPLPH